jgi:hypothetical protein
MRNRQQTRIKAEYAGSQPFRKRTNNFDSPPCDDRHIRTISRTEVEVYEADNAIDNVALRREIDRRPQVKPRLARVRVIIIEFVNLVLDSTDRIRRVGRNSREKKKKVSSHRKFLTDEQEIS